MSEKFQYRTRPPSAVKHYLSIKQLEQIYYNLVYPNIAREEFVNHKPEWFSNSYEFRVVYQLLYNNQINCAGKPTEK